MPKVKAKFGGHLVAKPPSLEASHLEVAKTLSKYHVQVSNPILKGRYTKLEEGVNWKGAKYGGRPTKREGVMLYREDTSKVEEPPYNEGASIFMEVPPNVEERYIYLEDVNALKEGASQY